jgi:uncharacterized protein
VEQVTVYKLNENGAVVWQYPAAVLKRTQSSVRLEAFFNRDDLDLGFTTFKRGDRFVETFYSSRWYNVFAVYDVVNGNLKGWYCNICRPAHIQDTAVRCEDLALDLWVPVAGEMCVLDEDEFEELRLDVDERQNCLAALQELQDIAKLGQLPC